MRPVAPGRCAEVGQRAGMGRGPGFVADGPRSSHGHWPWALLARLVLTHVRVAARRRSLWKAIIPVTLLVTLSSLAAPLEHPGSVDGMVYQGQMFAMLGVLVYAASFTDLFTAAHRRGLGEVEVACPGGGIALAAARLAGSFAVAITPPTVALLLTGVVQVTQGNAMAPLQALAIAATIVAPATLLSMAFSGLAGALLPRSVARVAALVVWCLVVFTTPTMPVPTLNGSVLTLMGDAVATGFFGTEPGTRPVGPLAFDGSAASAVVSLAWEGLLIAALVALGTCAARWRSRRRR